VTHWNARWAVPSLFALVLATPAQAQSPPAGWSDFTRLFDQETTRDGIVGASAIFVRSGTIVGRIDRGLADRDLNQRVDARTLFHWASITKTLTAIAIMQLVERKRIALDDHIVRWVPELRLVHDSFNGAMETVTLRMLLSHSAGFQGPTWPYHSDRSWEPFEPTQWSQLVAMMPYQELGFRPGSKFGYSNPAYIYLARVIEAVTGDPWEVYVQKNIFAPLGLTSSYFGATPYHLSADRANSYILRREASGKTTLVAIGREFDPGITIPNGGWNAPLSDLAMYMGFLAGSRESETMRRYEGVLRHRTLEQMWKPLLQTDPNDREAPWMGLGFFVSKSGKPLLVEHTGSQAGFNTFFLLNPKTGTAIVAAFNTAGNVPSVQTLHRAARSLLVREE
jgi:CubicO group peptidase (beta-lactamase class C family)